MNFQIMLVVTMSLLTIAMYTKTAILSYCEIVTDYQNEKNDRTTQTRKLAIEVISLVAITLFLCYVMMLSYNTISEIYWQPMGAKRANFSAIAYAAILGFMATLFSMIGLNKDKTKDSKYELNATRVHLILFLVFAVIIFGIFIYGINYVL